MPRTYHFNRLLAADLFYLEVEGVLLPVLNLLDHGSGFQVCELVSHRGTRTAKETWAAFERSWVRYFGPPEVIITDGGPEFLEAFDLGCEHLGMFPPRL